MRETEPQVRSIAVPSVATSVAAARRLVAETLGSAAVEPDTVDTAVLLTSEVVTNAVLHARTDVVVSVRIEGPVAVVEVRDGSTALPSPRPHETESMTGRGLDLVELLAADFGIRMEPDGRGKTVWFSLGGSPARRERGWGSGGAPCVTVGTLHGIPVGLYRVLHEQNEALLREYELYLLDEAAGPEPEPGQAAVSSRAELAAATRARARFASVMFDALEDQPDDAHATVVVTAEPDDVPGLRVLLPVLEAAEGVAADEVLLTPPALPELRAFRRWMYSQLVAQLDGADPVPWASPRDDELPDPILPRLDVDTSWVAAEARGVVVADDTNRILAASTAAADLLGWQPGELHGRRLTAIVPPELREAHLAGFTRHLVTGHDRILGGEVALEAVRRDRTRVPVRLTLERRRAGWRSYYVGWLEPAAA